MIKFPSIQTLSSQLLATVKRFPLAILCAVMGSGILIHLTRHSWLYYGDNTNTMLFWGKLAMCSELGLCLFTAVSLLAEAKSFAIANKVLINIAALALITAYYFSIKHNEHFEAESFTRYTLYIIAAHLFVAFAPFTGKGHINGFWQFNKALFLRFLLSFLYTVVLYGGICIAMVLLDELLHVNIHSNYYAYAWFCMIGIFNTLFFLAGVPKNITGLDSDTTYLKGLKAFTQFVLLPLVTMYLLILYAYMVRILIVGSLPKGYVSYLVISFSGMGILSLLLIYPIRNLDDNKWIHIFSKWFYRALYPLIILLAFSIYHRVSEYGITADRYFIVLLAIWLACIAAYFLFSKRENIKLIPISLCVISVCSTFGPWGAFGIAASSQTHQLEKLLEANKVLVNGKISKGAAANVPDSVSRRAESIIRYLVEIDEQGKLQPWVKQNLDSLHDSNSYTRYSYNSYREGETIMSYMGFTGYTANKNSYYDDYDKYEHMTFTRENTSGKGIYSVDIKGYDYYAEVSPNYTSASSITDPDTSINHYDFAVGTDTFTVVPFKQPAKYAFVLHGKTVAVLELEGFFKALQKKYDATNNGYFQLPAGELTVIVNGNGYDFKVVLSDVAAIMKNEKLYISSFTADILTKTK